MPFGYLTNDSQTQMDDLRIRLTAEWNALLGPTTAAIFGGQPVLIEDKGRGGQLGARPSTHLYVIWDEWEPLTQEEQSEGIMDAYEATHENPEIVRVTLAKGLTENEARSMGLRYTIK